VTSQYDVKFRFATNVLVKFVDATCIYSDAGAAPDLDGGGTWGPGVVGGSTCRYKMFR